MDDIHGNFLTVVEKKKMTNEPPPIPPYMGEQLYSDINLGPDSKQVNQEAKDIKVPQPCIL